MTGKGESQETRLLAKLERLTQSGSSEMGFVAEELQHLYERELSGVDLKKANPEQKTRIMGILKKIGDVNNMVGRYENAKGFYDQVLRAEPDSILSAEIHRAMGLKERDATNWAKADQHFKRSLDICTARKDDIGMAESHHYIGYVLWRRGEFDLALNEYSTAIRMLKAVESRPDMRRQAEEKLAIMMIEQGNILGEKGNLEEALMIYKEALAVLTRLENRWEMARIHNNIGHLLVNLDRFDEAMKEFEACLKLAQRMKDQRWQGWSKFNMAEVLGRKGNGAKAKVLAEEAMKHLMKIQDNIGLAKANYTFAYAYMAEGNIAQAKKKFEESIDAIEKNDMPTLAAYYTFQYALALIKMGDKQLALRHFKKSLQAYKRVGSDGYVKKVQEAIEKYSKTD